MVAHSCYPSTWKTEVGGSRVGDQPGLLETISNEEGRERSKTFLWSLGNGWLLLGSLLNPFLVSPVIWIGTFSYSDLCSHIFCFLIDQFPYARHNFNNCHARVLKIVKLYFLKYLNSSSVLEVSKNNWLKQTKHFFPYRSWEVWLIWKFFFPCDKKGIKD